MNEQKEGAPEAPEKTIYTREALLELLNSVEAISVSGLESTTIRMKKIATRHLGENPDEVEAVDMSGPFRMSIDDAVEFVNKYGISERGER